MSRICQLGQIVLLISIVMSASCRPTNEVVKEAIKLNSHIVQSVKEADLIVVGRVIGIVDTKPDARTRKHLEAHWILVERTLKGIDETSQQLAARPNGLLWEDGKSYIIFLKRKGMGNFVEAISQQLVEATQANIAAIDDEVAAQGGGVIPKPVLWMQHTSSWRSGVIAEFFVAADGNFEWKQQLQVEDSVAPEYEKLTGSLPEDAIADLIGQVVQVEGGLIADDADTVTFRWLDEKGETQFKACYTLDNPPCTELLETIEMLARRHGQVPKAQN